MVKGRLCPNLSSLNYIFYLSARDQLKQCACFPSAAPRRTEWRQKNRVPTSFRLLLLLPVAHPKERRERERDRMEGISAMKTLPLSLSLSLEKLSLRFLTLSLCRRILPRSLYDHEEMCCKVPFSEYAITTGGSRSRRMNSAHV